MLYEEQVRQAPKCEEQVRQAPVYEGQVYQAPVCTRTSYQALECARTSYQAPETPAGRTPACTVRDESIKPLQLLVTCSNSRKWCPNVLFRGALCMLL